MHKNQANEISQHYNRTSTKFNGLQEEKGGIRRRRVVGSETLELPRRIERRNWR